MYVLDSLLVCVKFELRLAFVTIMDEWLGGWRYRQSEDPGV
jgi:hypothetical protein